MNATTQRPIESEKARRRLLSVRGEPLFLARWDRAVFLHYEADPEELQRCVPFPLDLHHGRAFVSLVAFTMRGMRPRFAGSLGKLLFTPIATHSFLNARTYVLCNGEPGIYFLAEWLSSRLASWLGPPAFGLPYRFGELRYRHAHESGTVSGSIAAGRQTLGYTAAVGRQRFQHCERDSTAEFLLERYTAFTKLRDRQRFFRVWHEPWLQLAIRPTISGDDLISTTGSWWRTAQFHSANYSPGVDVWMGWPHRL